MLLVCGHCRKPTGKIYQIDLPPERAFDEANIPRPKITQPSV